MNARKIAKNIKTVTEAIKSLTTIDKRVLLGLVLGLILTSIFYNSYLWLIIKLIEAAK
jgi:hypothetical protein